MGSGDLPGTGQLLIPTRNTCTNIMMGQEDRSSRQQQFHPHPTEGSMLALAASRRTPRSLAMIGRKPHQSCFKL